MVHCLRQLYLACEGDISHRDMKAISIPHANTTIFFYVVGRGVTFCREADALAYLSYGEES